MITCSVTIFPVLKPEPVKYADVVCVPSAVSVDSNNIQMHPLKIRSVNHVGGQLEELKAYIRVRIKSGDIELGRADSGGSLSEWEYYLPSDKWGEADNIVVESYEDPHYVKLLAEKQVSILRQHATPFPIEGDWRQLPFKYKNGEYFIDSKRNLVFQWINPVSGNSEIHPFEDIKSNPNTTSWKQHTQWILLATQVFLANFAKLGGAVFDGDYTISQYGKDNLGEDSKDYTKFKVDKDGKLVGEFTPNFMVDWLKGKVSGNDMEVKGGRIGNFKIIRNSLRNIDGNDCWISIFNEDENYSQTSSVGNDLPATAGRRTAGRFIMKSPDTNTALVLSAKGSERKVYGTTEYANYCIDANGGVLWEMDRNDYWHMPGVLFGGHYGGGGEEYEKWGNGTRAVYVQRESTGTYHISHQIGHMSYFVAITPMRNWTFATLQHKDANSFSFTIADANRGLIDSEFDVMIFGIPFS